VDRGTSLFAGIALLLVGAALAVPGSRLPLGLLAAIPGVIAARRARIPGTSSASRTLWVFAVLALLPALDGEDWLALAGPAALLAALLALVLRTETPKSRAIGFAAVAVSVAAVPTVALLGVGFMGLAHSREADAGAAIRVLGIGLLPIVVALGIAVARAQRCSRIAAGVAGVLTIPVAFGLMSLGLQLAIQRLTYINDTNVPLTVSWERAGPGDRSLGGIKIRPACVVDHPRIREAWAGYAHHRDGPGRSGRPRSSLLLVRPSAE
jgi:hypothetical protein